MLLDSLKVAVMPVVEMMVLVRSFQCRIILTRVYSTAICNKMSNLMLMSLLISTKVLNYSILIPKSTNIMKKRTPFMCLSQMVLSQKDENSPILDKMRTESQDAKTLIILQLITNSKMEHFLVTPLTITWELYQSNSKYYRMFKTILYIRTLIIIVDF
jgi:hypothetical protein